jgi:hypothetical protein
VVQLILLTFTTFFWDCLMVSRKQVWWISAKSTEPLKKFFIKPQASSRKDFFFQQQKAIICKRKVVWKKSYCEWSIFFFVFVFSIFFRMFEQYACVLKLIPKANGKKKWGWCDYYGTVWKRMIFLHFNFVFTSFQQFSSEYF